MSGLVWFLLIYYGGRAMWRRYQKNPQRAPALPAPALRVLTLLRRPLALYHTYYAAILWLMGLGVLLGATALLVGSLAQGMVGGMLATIPLFFLGRWLLRLGSRIGREELAVLRGQETQAASTRAIASVPHPLPTHPAAPKPTSPHPLSRQRVQGTLGAARAPQSPILHKKKRDKQFEQL